MIVLLVVTSTLSWEYHYHGGIRLVGLPRAGTVIQCNKEGYHHVAYVAG